MFTMLTNNRFARGYRLMWSGVKGIDYDLAWEAVQKNAFCPPDRDTELRYISSYLSRQQGRIMTKD